MTPRTPQRPWRLSSADPALVSEVARETGLSALTARILVARGVTDAAAAAAFLQPDLLSQWEDPAVLPGMTEAAERVAAEVRAGGRILVFGDFDLDGVSSAALTALGLRSMDADVVALVPHRFREGYGLTAASIERVMAEKPSLVVTVDCGISSAEEVRELRRLGTGVVVTDHHEPGAGVPVDVPVADPKLGGAEGPGLHLAGAGVALKLIHAVGGLLGTPDAWLALTDLAALGTIADIVPVIGENRALVTHGLAAMRAGARPGIVALAAVAEVDLGALDAEDVAYSLAPRLNAAGRMADPAAALALLTAQDAEDAEGLARALDEHNRVRQSIEAELAEAALAQAAEHFREGDRVLVLSGEGWHEGVKGIVASRLAARFGVPTLLFCVEDGIASGSGRSAGKVDLFAAVSACSSVLTRFGGHEAAVGLGLPAEDLPRLREALAAELATLPAETFEIETTVDAEVRLGDLSVELVEELHALAPFGHQNPRPLLAATGVFMSERKRVGRDGGHLRFTAYDGVAEVPAIAFRCRDIEAMLAHDAPVDLAFELTADEWQGRRRLQVRIRDHRRHAGDGPDGPAAELVEDLFARADELLAAGDYAGIAEAEAFHTKLVGVTFEGRQEAVARLTRGMPLRLERQPENPHDPNACALFEPHGAQVGFLNRRLAAALAPYLDAGVSYDAEVSEVTGGAADTLGQASLAAEERSLGVNVLLTRHGAGDSGAEEAAAARGCRERMSSLSPEARTAEIVAALIGERSLHAAQRKALDILSRGESCLAVMATGRGKSLVFQAHAARTAIAGEGASVFVYPLRALVADQSFHLSGSLAPLGVACRTVTGETGLTERDRAFEDLATGALDVVLTTPEFFERHAERFAASGRVRFVTVDEAHHVAASASHRPAYRRLGRALETLGRPVVFACSATCGDEVAEAVRAELGVSRVVVDDTVRGNLAFEDRRGSLAGEGRDAYVASLVARGEKSVVYVASRDQSVRLARALRAKVPSARHRVMFYNGALGREARSAVERAFRRGDLTAVVATSAFGEGVDIPDIRHVVLYHLPMGEVEFNQMSGRAGRDGAPAWIHAAFGERDARVNDLILRSACPDLDDMRALFAVLRDLCRESDGWAESTNAELADAVRARRKGSRLSERGVSAAVGVFRELGLAESEGAGGYRRLALAPANGRVELESSVRYAEGKRELEDFAAFKSWVLTAPAGELLARFNRPILPTQVPEDQR